MDRRILLLFALNLYCVYASPYDLNRLMKRGEKFCGSRLTAMLGLVCNGNFYSPAKKSYSGILNYGEYEDGLGTDNDIDQNDLIYPLLRKEYIKSLIPRKMRKTDGVVNECCYKPCSREQMRRYCAPE